MRVPTSNIGIQTHLTWSNVEDKYTKMSEMEKQTNNTFYFLKPHPNPPPQKRKKKKKKTTKKQTTPTTTHIA